MYRILLLTVLCVKFVTSTDYCNRELCKKQIDVNAYQYDKHIGCRHTRKNDRICPSDAQILPMSAKRKNLILRIHNRLRNKVALGELPGFNKAVRMPMVRWNDELAYLAELNVQQCQMRHDQCRNTDKFKYAGQNLAYIGGGTEPNAERIKTLIQMWFNEHKNASMNYIDKYRRHEKGYVIGHFTAMIQDRTDNIGCAILRHTRNTYFFLACNYSFTNMVNQKVYRKGKSCSKCRTGCSKIYKGLCKPHEYVDPDPYESLD